MVLLPRQIKIQIKNVRECRKRKKNSTNNGPYTANVITGNVMVGPMESSHQPINIHLKCANLTTKNMVHSVNSRPPLPTLLPIMFNVLFLYMEYGFIQISYHSFSTVELLAAFFRVEAATVVVSTRVYSYYL